MVKEFHAGEDSGFKNLFGQEVLMADVYGNTNSLFPDIQFFFILNERQGIATLIVK